MTVEQAAQLNVMIYYDIEFEKGITLKDQILELYNNQEQWNHLLESNNLFLIENKARDVLNSIMYDDELANLKIVDVSGRKQDGTPINLCLENEKEKEVLFLFRGTNGREWYDNAMGFLQTSSILQRKALEFVNDNINRNDYVERGYTIDVTGHSKGGNKAQFVTILNNNINKCYSFDGQGFSQEFIDKYAFQIKQNSHKITQYAAHKDFVHPLGYNIANKTIWYETHKPYENLFGLEKVPGVSVLLAHSPAAMLHFENGKLHMNKEVKQSKLSAELAEKSELMMKLPREEKTVYFTSIMAAIQYMHTSTPIMEGDRMPNIKETSKGITQAVKFLERSNTSTGLKYLLSCPCLQLSSAVEGMLNLAVSDKKIGNDILEILEADKVRQLTDKGKYNIYQFKNNADKTFIGKVGKDNNVLRTSQYSKLTESTRTLKRGISSGTFKEHELERTGAECNQYIPNYLKLSNSIKDIESYMNNANNLQGIENQTTTQNMQNDERQL